MTCIYQALIHLLYFYSRMFHDVRDPDARVRCVCEYGCQVQVDSAIPVKRYFRSGKEIIRMANVYLEDKEFESAFILYSKFIA